MTRRALLLLPVALLCLAAAPAPKTAAPKASAKPAAAAPARAAPAKSQAAAGPFDAQNPQGLIEVLTAAGAKVQSNRREEDTVFVTVTSAAAGFSMQFAGCNPQGRACKAVLLDAGLQRGTVTVSQINGFNQTSVMCRIYQDRTGAPHVLYSAILTRSMTRDDAATQMLAWQGCLADAHDFLRDPVAYLANAA